MNYINQQIETKNGAMFSGDCSKVLQTKQNIMANHKKKLKQMLSFNPKRQKTKQNKTQGNISGRSHSFISSIFHGTLESGTSLHLIHFSIICIRTLHHFFLFIMSLPGERYAARVNVLVVVFV